MCCECARVSVCGRSGRGRVRTDLFMRRACRVPREPGVGLAPHMCAHPPPHSSPQSAHFIPVSRTRSQRFPELSQSPQATQLVRNRLSPQQPGWGFHPQNNCSRFTFLLPFLADTTVMSEGAKLGDPWDNQVKWAPPSSSSAPPPGRHGPGVHRWPVPAGSELPVVTIPANKGRPAPGFTALESHGWEGSRCPGPMLCSSPTDSSPHAPQLLRVGLPH